MPVVKKYECLVGCTDRVVTVSVYTASKDKEVIKKLAVERAEEFLNELDIPFSEKDTIPVSFRDCGSWEVMPDEENV